MFSDYMKRCLVLAAKARLTASPNPMVGCVVVKNHQIIAEGYHQGPGEPHAEVVALQQAGEQAQGATVYVNLEPCNHTGRTPPCVDALIQAGVARVVMASADPNPLVTGGGAKRLQAAGIDVVMGDGEQAALSLNHIFYHAHQHQRPYVIAKYAMTLDGKIASHARQSKWISDASARESVHELRQEVDAITIGANTAREDDPALTVRLPDIKTPKHPVRFVFTTRGLPNDLQLLQANHPGKTYLVTTPDAYSTIQSSAACETMIMTSWDEWLAELYQWGITSLLIEGGQQLLTDCFSKNVIDEIHTYIGCLLLGGETAPSPFGGEGFLNPGVAPHYELQSVDRFDETIRIISTRRMNDV